MLRNFDYLIVFTSAPSVLPEQNDRYRIKPGKVNEIKAYKKLILKACFLKSFFDGNGPVMFTQT